MNVTGQVISIIVYFLILQIYLINIELFDSKKQCRCIFYINSNLNYLVMLVTRKTLISI